MIKENHVIVHVYNDRLGKWVDFGDMLMCTETIQRQIDNAIEKGIQMVIIDHNKKYHRSFELKDIKGRRFK